MAISGISANYAYGSPYAELGARRQQDGQAADALPGSAQQANAANGAGGVNGAGSAQALPAPGSSAKGQKSGEKNGEDGQPAAAEKPAGSKAELTPEQRAQIAKLAARDREVRQHEAAHLAASGGLATSGASFTYQKGPDGVNYAIGGEVSIDTSAGRTPQETIDRARIIQAAALAPADPSGPDRAVAAAAQQLELKARAELAQQSAPGAVKSTTPATETGAQPLQAADPVAAKAAGNAQEKQVQPGGESPSPEQKRGAQAQQYQQIAGFSVSIPTAARSQVNIFA